MKIVIISDFFPPSNGGLERHVYTLATELSKNHSITVITLTDKDKDYVAIRDKIRIYFVSGLFQKLSSLYAHSNKKFPPPTPDLILIKKIWKILKNIQPEIVHVHGWIIYSVIPLKKNNNFKLICTLHDFGLICPKRTLIYKDRVCKLQLTNRCIQCAKPTYGVMKSLATFLSLKNNKSNLAKVDKFIAVSPFVKKIYQNHIPKEKITVIPNIYSEEKYKDTKNKLFPERFILFVGSKDHIKGLDILLKGFSQLEEKETFLVTITPSRIKMNQESRNVLNYSGLSRKDIFFAYKKALFIVIPSRCPDACPTVALEAMYNQKLIVYSKTGGLPYLIGNANRFSFNPYLPTDNIQLILKKVLEMDKKEVIDIGMENFQRYNKFFNKNMIIKLILKEYEKR